MDLSFANVDLSRAKLLLLESQITTRRRWPRFLLCWATKALQRRPEVAALQFQVESTQKNSIAEHDLWRPTVSALGVAGIAPVRDPQIHNWYDAVGVNINIPIFNGFLYNARAKTADLQIAGAADAVTPARIKRVLGTPAAEKRWTASTRNHYYSLISLAFRVGIENEKVEQNPARGVRRQAEDMGPRQVSNP